MPYAKNTKVAGTGDLDSLGVVAGRDTVVLKLTNIHVLKGFLVKLQSGTLNYSTPSK